MDIGKTSDVVRRAARHAALGDPARLRIVDALTLGDASPSELQQVLGMSSSLLAHHLNVLQGEGMITRARSEADRRRSYVRLAPGALKGLVPGAQAAARRVLFVCTANSARSQLAEALWQGASPIPSASAGTHPAPQVAAGAVEVAARHELTLSRSGPVALDQVLDAGDFVVTVCDNAHEELDGFGALHWSVPDPVRAGTDAAFEAAFTDLERRVRDLAPRLTPA